MQLWLFTYIYTRVVLYATDLLAVKLWTFADGEKCEILISVCPEDHQVRAIPLNPFYIKLPEKDKSWKQSPNAFAL